MYILFEEHQYESSRVEKVLKDIYVLQDVDKKVSVQYVGYFYNPHLNDCVFILPKVLLTEQEVLVGVKQKSGEPVTPEMVLEPKGQEELSKDYRKFIYEFSVWIYRALNVFYKANPKSKAILYKHLPQAGKGRRHQAKTYLDIVLSLINFNKENRDFVLFTIKNLHRGNNKINWTRTISHSQAFVQDNDVVYLNPVNKKRIVNYEEELFVIFYSILNYLNVTYGFRTPINIQYELITGKQFKLYLHGMGKTKLMQIKYKYFSDKALQLWDLCYAFFEKSYRIAINTNAQEYLLAKSFNIVFEAMIDELIGTPHHDIPKGLADQDDGKRVDHLYTDLALTSPDEQTNREVYYIGDSKYYKSGHSLTSESIYKQYTYAKNVIQWNINLFLDNYLDKEDQENREQDRRGFKQIRLQDTYSTEGYDVIPNFFISGTVDDRRQYVDSEPIHKHKKNNEEHCTKLSYQFPDRLFDRDTLFLSQYDVNFLYVLYLYARNKASEKAAWKKEVRRIFREEIRDVVQKEFQIYAMQARAGVDGPKYLREHFYDLNGRVYQPYGEKRKIYFAYARPIKKFEETEGQYQELKKHFYIKECDMGDDPQKVLSEEIAKEEPAKFASDVLLDDYILIGCYRNSLQKDWVHRNCKYNIRLNMGNDNIDGAVNPSKEFMNVSHILLYNEEDTSVDHYYNIKKKDNSMPEVYGFEKMKELFYPFNIDRIPMDTYEKRLAEKYGTRAFLVYDFVPDAQFFLEDAKVDLVRLLGDYIDENMQSGSPFVISMNDLKKYL